MTIDYKPALLHASRTDHKYIEISKFPLPSEKLIDNSTFCWLPQSMWGAWPDLSGATVGIVANRPLRGLGGAIDACDEVIRLNRMPFWHMDAENDGLKATIWAGISAFPEVIPSPSDVLRPYFEVPSRFPVISDQLRLIWCLRPFDMSARFAQFIVSQEHFGKCLVTGDAYFLSPKIANFLPDDLLADLLMLPEKPHPLPHPFLDLLLSGVRATLLCFCAGAREIKLFGFDFYDSDPRKPWRGHDINRDRVFLKRITDWAMGKGCRISIVLPQNT